MPRFSGGADFGICDGQAILLQPVIESSSTVSYLWQNSSTASTFPITQPNTYKLDVSNYCGSTTDEVTVSEGVCKLYVPTAFSPNDWAILCGHGHANKAMNFEDIPGRNGDDLTCGLKKDTGGV
ncbi:MAG: hypothetical protein WDO16_08165 [Bacteroidota bacterium]